MLVCLYLCISEPRLSLLKTNRLPSIKLTTSVGFNRIAMSPITLSDGFNIPVGTYINMAAESMSRDPAYYQDPDSFNGYRFFDGTNETKPQEEFSGIENGNLAWGSGRLTCPGRWYASAMNKLIIGSLLADYEIKFPGDQKKRPRNLYSNGSIMPDPTQELLIRRLK
jgi:cytochrome P450